PFRAYLTRDARYLPREDAEPVDHRVDNLLDLEDLAARLDRDLPGEVAVRDRGRDSGDVPQLDGEVAGHRVDVVGQVGPDPADARHLCLSAQHSLGADLTGDPGDFVGEGAELIDHRVDGVLQLENLTFHI